MGATLWYERVGTQLLALPGRAFLACSRKSGIQKAVQRLHSLDVPVVELWVEEPIRADAISHLLAPAVSVALGAPLFGADVPTQQAIAILADYQRLVGPLSFVIGWANHCPEFALQLAAATDRGTNVLLVADSAVRAPAPTGFTQVSDAFLRLAYDEAILESRGAIADEDVAALLKTSGGQFARFKTELARVVGDRGGVLGPSSFWGHRSNVDIGGLVTTYLRSGRLPDAFDLACAHLPARVEELMDAAGHHYFNRGAYEYVWIKLSMLPPEFTTSGRVAYWLASSAAATNRQAALKSHASNVMSHHDAPELRATTAVALAVDDMLAETSLAVQKKRSAVTLWAHAKALVRAGHRAEPILLLREAMSVAERDEADHLVVDCAFCIAEIQLLQGNYKDSVDWARWALAEAEGREMGQTPKRVGGMALLATALLLLGQQDEAKLQLDRIALTDEQAADPKYGPVLSALGHLAFVEGDHDRAEHLYEAAHLSATAGNYCLTAINVLAVLLAKGKRAAAQRLAETAYTVSRTSGQYEAALGDLMMGMAATGSQPARAERHLLAALAGFDSTTADIHAAQAASWLAVGRLRSGQRKEATEGLKLGLAGIRQLGGTGWRLLCAAHPLTEAARRLWPNDEFEFEFAFLGGRVVRAGADAFDLGLRAAEIVAILAINQEGLSGELLSLHLYGDAQRAPSTLKSNISRLRELIPISSGPYKIDATYRVDFLHVLQCLSDGELQRALNLYKGPLLPGSSAPLIAEWRGHVDDSVRLAVTRSSDPDHLIQLATLLDDDLELWEFARNSVSLNDYRRPVINARIRRIRANWGKSAEPALLQEEAPSAKQHR